MIEKAAQDGRDIPSTVKIKLTGDGTRIGRGFNIVNIAFTVLEEGARAHSPLGNHVIAILKISENYEELLLGLKDIYEEAKDLDVIITIKDKVYKVIIFLGGDWKFLATVYVLENAASEFVCIWCKCPKEQQFDMTLQWSLTDLMKGARSVREGPTAKEKQGSF